MAAVSTAMPACAFLPERLGVMCVPVLLVIIEMLESHRVTQDAKVDATPWVPEEVNADLSGDETKEIAPVTSPAVETEQENVLEDSCNSGVCVCVCPAAVSTAKLDVRGVDRHVLSLSLSPFLSHGLMQNACGAATNFVLACSLQSFSMQEAREKLICSKCELEFDDLKAGHICNRCNTKKSACFRLFGTWPIMAFKALPQDMQLEWWRSDSANGDAYVSDLSKCITRVRTTRKVEKYDGGYYPLSWYEKNGFPAADIEKNCEDVEMHQVFGKTYRVDIHLFSSADIEDTVEKEIMQLLMDKKSGKASKHKKSKKGKKSKKSKKRSSSSRSSSAGSKSSSSSSSSKSSEPKLSVFLPEFMFAVSTA